jgi:fermentation-respiration switch protein FrsA (DUF1100 family)
VRALQLGLALAAILMAIPAWDRLVDRIVFQPTPGADLEPHALGIDAEDLWLEAEDGVRLHAFLLHAPAPASRAILLLHGNAGNASHRLPLAAVYAGLGADVLLLDYRGYGLSAGRPSEPGVYADARAALAALLARGFAERRVVLIGQSLGGAIAVDLAQERPLGGVVLESTFSSLADVARGAVGPVALLLRGRFDSAAKIARLRAPLLQLHGDRDEIVPFELGRALFRAAPEPKAFEALRGAGHNDSAEVGGPDYFARIGRFLDEVAPR